jgi:hypothetical protein
MKIKKQRKMIMMKLLFQGLYENQVVHEEHMQESFQEHYEKHVSEL